LALELEPGFKEKARANQRVGGQNKGSSNLTEAETLDVRRKIAAAAGVSVGNVTKVKQLTITAHSEIVQALRTGEIRIHRAWQWSKLAAEKQREELRQFRITRLIRQTNRNLISRHRTKPSPDSIDLGSLIRRLSVLDSKVNTVFIEVVEGRDLDRTVVVTEQLFERT
jgi:hypothetical protein